MVSPALDYKESADEEIEALKALIPRDRGSRGDGDSRGPDDLDGTKPSGPPDAGAPSWPVRGEDPGDVGPYVTETGTGPHLYLQSDKNSRFRLLWARCPGVFGHPDHLVPST